MMVWSRLKAMLGLSSARDVGADEVGSDSAGGTAECTGGAGGSGGVDGDGRPMIPCEEVLEKLYEYLDGELELVESEEMARHFEMCANCYPALAFEKSFLEALERTQRGTATPEPLRAKVLEALRKEGFTPSGTG